MTQLRVSMRARDQGPRKPNRKDWKHLLTLKDMCTVTCLLEVVNISSYQGAVAVLDRKRNAVFSWH